MATLQQLRSMFPSGKSDEDVLSLAAKQFGMNPVDIANDVGYDMGNGGLTSKRIGSAVDSYQSNWYGLGGAAARAVGMPGVGKWMDEGRDDNKMQSDVAAQRAKDMGGVDDWRDITGAGSAANWLGGQAAQALPYLAEAPIGGLAARGLMAGTRAALAGAQTVEAATAARRALNTGSVVGGAAASYPSAVGDILSNQREENGGEKLGMAALGGVPYAALNAFGVEGMLARGVRPRDLLKGGTLARVGKAAGITALEEGASETGQEMVNQGFGRMAVNPDQTMFNPEANKRYLDSFVGGAALGGVMGGAGGLRGRERVAPIADNEPRDLLTTSLGAAPDKVGAPQTAANPLGDITPDWGTVQGFEPRVSGIDPVGLYRAIDEPRVGPPRDGPLVDGYTPGRNGAGSLIPGMEFNPGVMGVAPGGMVLGNSSENELALADFSQDPGAEMARQQWLDKRSAEAAKAQAQQQQAQELQVEAQRQQGEKARIEAFGVPAKGDNHKLYQELEGLRDEGTITPAQFTENAAKLVGETPVDRNGARKFVRDIVKAQQPQPETTRPASVPTAKEVAAAADTPAPPADPMASTLAKLQGQAPKVPVAAANTAPIATETVAPKTTSGVLGLPAASGNVALPKRAETSLAVAGIEPGKSISVGRTDRRQDVTAVALYEKLVKAPEKIKQRMLLALGYEVDTNPDTGAETMIQRGNLRTFEQVAAIEAQLTGKKVTRQAIAQSLQGYGITEDAINRTAGGAAPDTVSDAEVGLTLSEGGESAMPGMRVETSAAKAFSAGMTEGGGVAPTKKQRQTEKDAGAILKEDAGRVKRAALDGEVLDAGQMTDQEAEAARAETNQGHIDAMAEATLATVEAEDVLNIWQDSEVNIRDMPRRLQASWVTSLLEISQEARKAEGDFDIEKAMFDTLIELKKEHHDITDRLAKNARVPGIAGGGNKVQGAIGYSEAGGSRAPDERGSRAPDGRSSGTKPEVEPDFSSIQDLTQRANAKWKHHKGDFSKLDGAEVQAVADRAAKFNNSALADTARAELERRATAKINADVLGPDAATAAAINQDVTGPGIPNVAINSDVVAPGVYAHGAGSVPLTADKWLNDAQVAQQIEQATARFAQLPRIEVRDSAVGVLPGVTVDSRVAGAVHEGAIYLFRDEMASGFDVQKTLFHEMLHYGLRKFLTLPEFVKTMTRLYSRDASIKAEADAWAQTEEGRAAAKLHGEDYATARGVDEALASLAEPGKGAYVKDGRGARAVRAVVQWLSDLARSFKMPALANRLQGFKNQEARAFIQEVFAKLEADTTPAMGSMEFGDTAYRQAAPLSSGLSDTAQRLAGRTGNMLASEAVQAAKKLGYSLLSLHDLVDEFKGKLPAVQDWYKGVQDSVATRNKLEALAESIASDAEKLPGEGKQRVSAFLAQSTTTQKWGYDPKIAGKTVVVDPTTEAAFKKLNLPERKVVQDVFQHGENMRVAQAALLQKLGVGGLFKGTAPLEGPYAPLKRFGNHVALLRSQKMQDVIATGKTAEIDALKRDPKHYRVSYFDTHGQAKAFARENDVANGGTFVFTDNFEKSVRVDEQRPMNAEVLQKVLAAVGVKEGLPAEAKAAVTRLVNDMYLQSIDEHSARTSGVHRFGRAGFEEDMIRSFLSHARAQAGFLANMEHGGAVNGAFYNMQRQAENEATGKRTGQDAFNVFAAHYAENLKRQDTPWQDRAMALTSAWQLATSVGYHVTNATQGMMVTVPKLAADFNDYSGAWKHLMAGYKQLAAGGMWGNFDIAKVKNAGLRAALQRASDAGVLDVGMDENLTQFEATRTGIAGVDNSTKVVRAALHKLRKVSRVVEMANRVAAVTAAYNMAIEHGKTPAQAQDYAVGVIQSTQGDFNFSNKPLVLKRLPKIMGQYRSYQFMMGGLYVKAFRQAVWGSVEEKAIGRRMLGYKLFHASMAAGALGLPMMNLAALVFSALGDDDEPKDLERSLREAVGDETLANLLLHGPLAYLGLDMSSKLGEDKIFSITPYGKFDLTSKKGMYETVAGVMGPSTALAGQFADATGKFKNGDYYKGLEGFMPKGISQAMKASRIANEGYTLTNGDVMFKPENINGFALVLDGLGLPSSELKRMSWIRSQQYEIGTFYKDRSTEIEREYARAVKGGDSEDVTALRQQWMDLQEGKRGMRKYFGDSQDALKHQPITTLLKYPATVAKRERKLQATVPQ